MADISVFPYRFMLEKSRIENDNNEPLLSLRCPFYRLYAGNVVFCRDVVPYFFHSFYFIYACNIYIFY